MKLQGYRTIKIVSTLAAYGCVIFLLVDSFFSLRLVAQMNQNIIIDTQKISVANSHNLDSVISIAARALDDYQFYYNKDIENDQNINRHFSISCWLLISLLLLTFSSHKIRKTEKG